jgi:hypothetical protein
VTLPPPPQRGIPPWRDESLMEDGVYQKAGKLRKDVIKGAPEIITSFSRFSDLSQKLLDSPESIKVFLS